MQICCCFCLFIVLLFLLLVFYKYFIKKRISAMKQCILLSYNLQKPTFIKLIFEDLLLVLFIYCVAFCFFLNKYFIKKRNKTPLSEHEVEASRAPLLLLYDAH